MRNITHYTDIPSTKMSWVIVECISVYHEGDERSRQHPGHGYPAHSEFTAKIILVFDNEPEFVETLGELIRQCGDSTRYRGFQVRPYEVKMELRIWPGRVVDDTNHDTTEIPAKNADKPLTSN